MKNVLVSGFLVGTYGFIGFILFLMFGFIFSYLSLDYGIYKIIGTIILFFTVGLIVNCIARKCILTNH